MENRDYELYSDTFSLDEISNAILRAESSPKPLPNGLSLPDIVNMMASMIISDIEEDSKDPNHDAAITKYHYREYYDAFSEYESIDKTLLQKLDDFTEERQRGPIRVEITEMCPVVTLGVYKKAILYAMYHNDQDTADKLTKFIIDDLSVDILLMPDIARVFYGRYYRFAENCMVVSQDLKDRFKNILQTEFDSHIKSAMKIVFEEGRANASSLEEKMSIDHSRAVNIVDQMELLGLVGLMNGSDSRKILIDKDEWQRLCGEE